MSCKVLIVEDSLVAAAIQSAQIQRSAPDFEVRIRRSFRGALEELIEYRPDVIVLDLNLPDSCSDETIPRIPELAHLHGSKVIATSWDEGCEAPARAGGADDFMTKLIGDDSSHFLKRITDLCAR